MFCEKCGAQNADNTAYCANCGAPLNGGQQQGGYQQGGYQQGGYQQGGYQQGGYQQQGYQQGGYQQPMYQQPYQAPVIPGKGLGIGSMVLGIIAICCCCIWYLSLPCAIVGLILGGVGASQASQAGQKNSMATAGITCSIIAIACAIIFLIYIFAIVESYSYYSWF